MTSHEDKLKRLLDGDIDESEIAADPILASLAERIFGLNIEPITPSKPSHDTQLPDVEVVTAVTSQDSMVEVVPGATLPTPLPMPSLPAIPEQVAKSGGGLLKAFGIISLLTAVANIFGAFGFLNSQCAGDKCASEATRINWAGIHNITNEQGWSMPFPELGIPDYVALACGIVVIILAFRRK
jgi:hypothetical protein